MTSRHWRVYALTWVAYATFYLGRKGFGVVKSRVAHETGLSPVGLAAIDTGYLTAYALGQFASGLLGDRIGARRLVSGALLFSALACLAFGSASSGAAFLVAFTANGLAQSGGWPGTTKAMAAFTTPLNRGAVMGVWATCYQVGGIAATGLAAALLARGGWRLAFLVPAAIMALVAVAVFTLQPDESSAEVKGESAAAPDPAEVAITRRSEQLRVLRSPAVWSYGVAYFAIKLIRYSLLFWLPYYLHNALHYDEVRAGYLSTSFEVGGIAGTIAFGALTDRVRALSRPAWSALSLIGLAGALLLYSHVAALGPGANFLSMALVGALLFGPDTVLSGCAAQDLGGRHAAATATGLVNGLGSFGAILQGAFTVGLSRHYGWNGLFLAFVVAALLGALALIPGISAARAARR